MVYGRRFQSGQWRIWEHTCTSEEFEAVLDSAAASAADHRRVGQPTHADYFRGARYVFDVAFGAREAPAEGDIWTYGIRIDQILFGDYEKLREHFATN